MRYDYSVDSLLSTTENIISASESVSLNLITLEVRKTIQERLGYEISGIADFMHSNPLMPSREATGIIRLAKINNHLSSKGIPPIHNIIYDTPLPISELLRERGGLGFNTGFLPKQIQLIAFPNRPYFLQKGGRVSESSFLDKVIYRHEYDYCKSAIDFIVNLIKRWNSIVEDPELYNSSLQIAKLKLYLWKNVGIENEYMESNIKSTLLSSILDLIPQILNIISGMGIPWWDIPGQKDKYLFRIFNQEGILIDEIFSMSSMPVFKNNLFDFLDWHFFDDIKRQNYYMVPCLGIYTLCLHILPQYMHYGNLYDRHTSIENWYKGFNPTSIGIRRLNKDGYNSYPVCGVDAPSSKGLMTYHSMIIDLCLHDINIYKEAIIKMAISGISLLPHINFNDVFPRK